MTNLLEITSDDIARLEDADLPELVGLLCEADYRAAGFPTAGILWGGHQDAGDGGLDVVVHKKMVPSKDGLIALCDQTLSVNPRSGQLFVFINRACAMIRVLFYDKKDLISWVKKQKSRACLQFVVIN